MYLQIGLTKPGGLTGRLVSDTVKIGMDGRTDGQTDEWMDGRTDGRKNRWMDGRTEGWTDGWTDKLTDGRTDFLSFLSPFNVFFVLETLLEVHTIPAGSPDSRAQGYM